MTEVVGWEKVDLDGGFLDVIGRTTDPAVRDEWLRDAREADDRSIGIESMDARSIVVERLWPPGARA